MRSCRLAPPAPPLQMRNFILPETRTNGEFMSTRMSLSHILRVHPHEVAPQIANTWDIWLWNMMDNWQTVHQMHSEYDHPSSVNTRRVYTWHPLFISCGSFFIAGVGDGIFYLWLMTTWVQIPAKYSAASCIWIHYWNATLNKHWTDMRSNTLFLYLNTAFEHVRILTSGSHVMELNSAFSCFVFPVWCHNVDGSLECGNYKPTQWHVTILGLCRLFISNDISNVIRTTTHLRRATWPPMLSEYRGT